MVHKVILKELLVIRWVSEIFSTLIIAYLIRQICVIILQKPSVGSCLQIFFPISLFYCIDLFYSTNWSCNKGETYAISFLSFLSFAFFPKHHHLTDFGGPLPPCQFLIDVILDHHSKRTFKHSSLGKLELYLSFFAILPSSFYLNRQDFQM